MNIPYRMGQVDAMLGRPIPGWPRPNAAISMSTNVGALDEYIQGIGQSENFEFLLNL